MRLSKAIEIGRGDVVSIVGAGGKTTTMFHLARELASEGWRVVTTTTTMIRREERGEHTILEPDQGRLLRKAKAALKTENHITLVSSFRETEGKLAGVEPSLVDELISWPEVDAVLVEADGAKGRSLKAPAAHEPVIPLSTSILVPVVGVDALGRGLDEAVAHRPQIVARLADAEPGEVITPGLVSRILLHPEGGLKNAPREARIIPLINKVTATETQPARRIAQLLLGEPRVQRVMSGAVADEDPVKEVWGRVAAVVLAAGESRRFGAPKQLLPWEGSTLLVHVVNTVLASCLGEIIVVLGHLAERIGDCLTDRPVSIVINDDWKNGLSTSVKAGLRALPANYEACLFLLSDQPNVTTELINAMVSTYSRTLAAIVAPACRGRRGNPVLFSHSVFPELLTMEGDQGGREVIRRHRDVLETVEVEQEDIFLDIDTVADYDGAR